MAPQHVNQICIHLAGAEDTPQSNDAQESAEPAYALESSSNNCATNGSLVNGSSVAKCLFYQLSVSNPTNSSGPTTPPHANWPQNEKSISPEDIAPTRCTVITSKRVTASPLKQTYYMERNHCISSPSPVKTNSKGQTKKDHVKGRLDFDGSDERTTESKATVEEISTSESEKDMNIFDIDLPNLDAIVEDFSFTEMLEDFNFECEEIGYSCQPSIGSSVGTASRYFLDFFLFSYYFSSLLMSDVLLYILNIGHLLNP